MTDRLRLHVEIVHPIPTGVAPEGDARTFYQRQRGLSPAPLPEEIRFFGWIFSDEQSARARCMEMATVNGPALAMRFQTSPVSWAWMIYAVMGGE